MLMCNLRVHPSFWEWSIIFNPPPNTLKPPKPPTSSCVMLLCTKYVFFLVSVRDVINVVLYNG